MRTRHLSGFVMMSVGAANLIAAGNSDDAVRSLARYEHIWISSPFVAATVASPGAEGLAQRYALTGYANLGGDDIVFLLDRRSLKSLTVSKGLPQEGVELISVSESGDSSELKAKIRVGQEVSDVSYDPKATESVAAASSNSPDGAPLVTSAAKSEAQAAEKKVVTVPQATRVIQKKNVITPK